MKFEENEFGFMMTKVRAAFRLKLNKEAKAYKNTALKQVAFRMQMDRRNKVHTLVDLGLTDPFKTKKTIDDALLEVRTFDFWTEVYPDSVMEVLLEAVRNKENVHPPKCIFVPDRVIVRHILKALIKFKEDSDEIFLLRFGLHE